MLLSNNQLQVMHEYLMEDAPVLYLLLNNDGLVIAANKFTTRTLEGPVIGALFDDLLLNFNKSFDLEECIHTPKQHLLSVKTSAADPQSYFFTFRKIADSILVFGKDDVDELEILRSELFRSNQELNNLTRTLHKKNAQLAHLNTIKNQFLGMAAHDLRKPISVILSYSEFLVDEAQEQLDEEQMSFLDRIENSALFMKRLVDDFLDVSAIEAGRFQLNVKPTSLTDVLERSLVVTKIQAAKKGVELEVAVNQDLPDILIDGDKIEQAMSNLLCNAIEHSARGSDVTITLKEIDGQLSFSVHDRGAGMSKEVMEQLFTPFSNSGNLKTGGEKSTGLGLTITRKIVDAHQGKIIAESKEGSGTTFTILFDSGMPPRDNG